MSSDHFCDNNDDDNTIKKGNIKFDQRQQLITNKQSRLTKNSNQHVIQNLQFNGLNCQLAISDKPKCFPLEKIVNKSENLKLGQRQLFKQQYEQECQNRSSKTESKYLQQHPQKNIEFNFEEIMVQNVQLDDYSNQSINLDNPETQPLVETQQKQENEQELQQEEKQYFPQNQDIPQVDKKIQEEINNLNIKLRDHKCIIRKFLAEGGFGKVYEGTFNEANQTQEVVFKILHDCRKDEIQNEVDIMKIFERNINIIQFIKWIKLDEFDVLILQKCKFSLKYELNEILDKQLLFSENKLRQVFMDLLDGLIQLRIFKTLHLDIKPDNILITEEGNYLYSDFGISCQFKLGEVDVKGYTRKYAPKEQINYSKNINYLSDVYSLGKTFEEIIRFYRLRNQDNHNSELLIQIEDIIKKKMTRDSQNERQDCENLHNSFFEAFIKQNESQEFKIQYYQKINDIINVSIFNNNKDIPFNLDLILYYLNLQLTLNQSFQFHPIVQFQLYYELAYHYELKGKYYQSLKFCLLSLEISTKFFPVDKLQQPPLLMLANLYSQIGDSNIGLLYSFESLEWSLSLFNDNHPLIATCLNDIGTYYSKLGDSNNALKYSLQSLEMRKKLFKEDHPDIASSLNDVSTFFSELGDLKNALKYSLQSLEIYKQILSDDHPTIAASLQNIGKYYGDLGDFKNALKYSLQSLEMRKQFYKDHPDIAMSLNNVSAFYNKLGDQNNALKYSLQSLSMYKQFFKGNHPQIAFSLNNVGAFYSQLGDEKNAIKHSIQSLEMRKQLFSGNHPDIAFSLNCVAKIQNDFGNYKNALKYSLESLEMRKQLFNGNHPDIAVSLNNVAKFYNDTGDSKNALKNSLQSLKMMKQLFKEGHPDIAGCLNNIGKYQNQLGYPKKALKYFLQSLGMYKQFFNEGHPHLAMSLNNIGAQYSTLGDSKNALKYSLQYSIYFFIYSIQRSQNIEYLIFLEYILRIYSSRIVF